MRPARLLVLAVLTLATRPTFAAPPTRTSVDLVVTAGTVLTVDPEFRILPESAVAIQGGAIVAIGSPVEIARRYAARRRIDRPHSVLMPGLVNTHTHAAMSLLRGIADDRPLMEWLQKYIFPAEAKNVSPAFVRDGTNLAMAEMIRSGTTTFADMYYFEDDVARAVDAAGMRGVLGETWIDFPAPDNKTHEQALAYTRKFLAAWKGNRRVVAAIAPHAPYTCSAATYRSARQLADEFGAPLMTHLSGSTEPRRPAGWTRPDSWGRARSWLTACGSPTTTCGCWRARRSRCRTIPNRT